MPACSSTPVGAGPRAAAIAASRVHHESSPDRPALALVDREGDPQRGLAVAVHVPSSAGALALSILMELRIRGGGFPAAQAHASASGFVLRDRAHAPDDIQRFLVLASRASSEPASSAEIRQVADRMQRALPRVVNSPSEAALARCSGEPALDAPFDVSQELPRALSGWQRDLSAADVAFAVVGDREHLEAAKAALTALPRWSRVTRAGAVDIGGDRAGGAAASGGKPTLSVALWGVPSAAAIAAAERLAEPDSMLSVRLGAGAPSWRVARVASQLASCGACLRVDLEASGAAPTFRMLATSARAALDEIEHISSRVKPGPWMVSKQVLAAERPDEAAAIAAWQALHGADHLASGAEPRRLVHYSGELADRVQQAQWSSLLEPATAASDVEVRRAVEPGQGKYWLLLASPCGTSDEDASSAGSLALALHSSALAHAASDGVALEPWLNVDAMGLLAHAPAATPHENPEAQAERVAEALARALLRPGPSPEFWLASREALLEGLGQGPTPALSLALRQTSADHPSWLDARGTWTSLSSLSARAVELRRESFLRGKLRLASLANHDERQSAAGEQRLLGLLRAADAGLGECPVRRTPAAAAGQYHVDTFAPGDPDVVISVPLPSEPDGLPVEALWTESLMNRSGGWLQQALIQPGLVSHARARAVGGAFAAALLIEIHVMDGRHEEAVAQVRGLLDRLRAGAAQESDVQIAQEAGTRRASERLLDPRGRLVELWRARAARSTSLASLRAFHRSAFEPGREVVVLREAGE